MKMSAHRLMGSASNLVSRLGLCAILFAGAAQAATINGTLIPSGTQWPGLEDGDKADVSSRSPNTFPAPPDGTRNSDADMTNQNRILAKDFQCAVLWWQAAVGDNITLKLSFGWDDIVAKNLGPPSTLAVFQSTKRDGNNRTIEGVIRFNNDAAIPWFLDDTPPSSKKVADGNTEFGAPIEDTADLGAKNKNINIDRYRTANVGGDADGRADGGTDPVRYDIFTVTLHEIGHAMGVDADTNYDPSANGGSIKLTKDRPAGSDTKDALIGTITNTANGDAKGDQGLHLMYPHSVMYPNIAPGERRLLSSADILAASELSDFTNVNLDPPGHTVPEPSGMLAIAGAALLLQRRRAHVGK
jgi:hypothetical protein